MSSKRGENEPLLLYWFRQFKEEPLPVLTFGSLLSVIYLWHDAKRESELHRDYMREQSTLQVECIKEQTRAFTEVSAELKLIGSRLGHVERELEIKTEYHEKHN